MARSNIRNDAVQATSDNGSVRLSVIKGEQSKYDFTLKWFTNLAGSKITARFIEGDNSNEDGEIPSDVKSGETAAEFVILDEEGNTLSNNTFPQGYSSNKFQMIIPDDAFDSYSPQPKPDVPVYAFFDITVEDSGSGDNQQIYKAVRGVVAIRYTVGG